MTRSWQGRMEGDGPYAWMIGRRFQMAAERLGLDKPQKLRTDLFTPTDTTGTATQPAVRAFPQWRRCIAALPLLRKPMASSDSFDMESSARAHPGLPNFDLETEMMALHGLPVAGIDEAGRGPWAGPVVVGRCRAGLQPYSRGAKRLKEADAASARGSLRGDQPQPRARLSRYRPSAAY